MNLLKRADLYWNKSNHAAYLFIAPAAIIVILFSILPLIASIFISMTNANVYFTDINFVWFENYIKAFNDSKFINAWKITLLFTLFDVPISIGFSLFIAALVNGTGLRHKLFRAIYILPLICSAAVIGVMWKLFLNPNIGWGVLFMEKLGLPKLAIFSDYKLAIYGIIFISIWRSFGVMSMILVAGMQVVSKDLYEGAAIDGANKFHQFFSVTLPSISSTLWFVIITRVIGSFQVFDLVYVITDGGPANSTQTVVNYVYDKAFSTDIRLGYATAMSEVLFFVIILITIILYIMMIRQEKERGVN